MSKKANEEKFLSALLYQKEVDVLRKFMKEKRIPAIRDAVRICVEFTNAHGGLS